MIYQINIVALGLWNLESFRSVSGDKNFPTYQTNHAISEKNSQRKTTDGEQGKEKINQNVIEWLRKKERYSERKENVLM